MRSKLDNSEVSQQAEIKSGCLKQEPALSLFLIWNSVHRWQAFGRLDVFSWRSFTKPCPVTMTCEEEEKEEEEESPHCCQTVLWVSELTFCYKQARPLALPDISCVPVWHSVPMRHSVLFQFSILSPLPLAVPLSFFALALVGKAEMVFMLPLTSWFQLWPLYGS